MRTSSSIRAASTCSWTVTAFDGAVVLSESMGLDTQPMIDYITNELGSVIDSEYADPYGQGRIVITE